MNIKQGEIYLANLNPVKGHEQAGYRPVVVLQKNILNTRLNTVVIAPITSNLQANGYLTTVYLGKAISGLNQDSVALLFQLRTIDKLRLKKKVGRVPREVFVRMKSQLRLLF